jgi:hypothetical protein
VVFLESSQSGDMAVFYWLADDPQNSLHAFAASSDPFDAWLRTRASAAHPVPLEVLTEIAAKNTLIARYPH